MSQIKSNVGSFAMLDPEQVNDFRLDDVLFAAQDDEFEPAFEHGVSTYVSQAPSSCTLGVIHPELWYRIEDETLSGEPAVAGSLEEVFHRRKLHGISFMEDRSLATVVDRIPSLVVFPEECQTYFEREGSYSCSFSESEDEEEGSLDLHVWHQDAWVELSNEELLERSKKVNWGK